MNNHPHEVKMDMQHQHEVKMIVHSHDMKMLGQQSHEMQDVKLNHHEMKMNMGQNNDLKMVMGQNHEMHDVKMGILHDMHDVKMNMHQNVQVMPHVIEVNINDMGQVQQEIQPIQVHLLPQESQQQQQQQNQQQSQPSQQQTHQKQVKEERKSKIDKKKKEAIDGQAKEVIFKVIKFFESEKQNRGYAYPVENVIKRACAATGLSESTIKRIKREGIQAEATQTRMTGPKKKRIRKTKVQLDYFQLCALRGIVNSYSARKEVPTLGKILASAKHELNYRGGKESLRLILLNKLGIKFKKCEKKIKKVLEPPPPPQPVQQQQMQNVMQQPQMQHMKVIDNQCVYSVSTNMLPPVSY